MDEQRANGRDHNLNELFDIVRKLSRDFGELKGSFISHMRIEEVHYTNFTNELQRLSDTVESLTVLHKAFPADENGVPKIQQHHDDHLERIEEREKSKAFWEKVKAAVVSNLIEKAVTAAMVGLAVVIMLGTKEWVIQLLKGIA